ncbi:MAG: glucosamine-6-phosphate deaminase [Actinomycetales bacterium mxb001]|nr:MAG: glucosamine-6-phosphate deaminase [Actinomycetales bacterium mxb001]
MDRGSVMAAEIAEQPRSLARLLADGLPAIRSAADVVRTRQPRFVLLAARGTSDHAALYAKYLIETRLGLPAGLVSPSTLTVYDSTPSYADVLWIAVSQSGGSPDLVESTQRARRAGALTIALTNADGSPLASAADLHVDVLAGPERAVAATKSYTSELLALWLLIDAWVGGDASPARVIPERAQAVVDLREGIAVAPRYRFVERLITTGRGFAYPTAREAALKLMETSYLAAHAFSSADLMHGPLAMIDEDRPVIAVVPYGAGGAAMQPVLDRLAESGADLLVEGDASRAPSAAAAIWLPDDVPEDLAPILQIIPLQQLAYAMAVARGYDPDAPRGLRKVTETR